MLRTWWLMSRCDIMVISPFRLNCWSEMARVFGPANSGVLWRINAREVGSDNVLFALIVLEDASFALQTCESPYCIFAVMISNMVAILFISWM